MASREQAERKGTTNMNIQQAKENYSTALEAYNANDSESNRESKKEAYKNYQQVAKENGYRLAYINDELQYGKISESDLEIENQTKALLK
jgi:hypothetical protein